SVADAAAGADFKVKGMAPDLLDQSHKNAWPITSATYMLAYEKSSDAAKQKGVVDFYTWSLKRSGHGCRPWLRGATAQRREDG
ncbi:MAG: hypothetical protein WA108_01600, partial [Thiobacillus sp.]